MTAVPASFVMVRSLNPVMSLNAERSMRSSPSVKSWIVSVPCPASNTKVSLPEPPWSQSSSAPP